MGNNCFGKRIILAFLGGKWGNITKVTIQSRQSIVKVAYSTEVQLNKNIQLLEEVMWTLKLKYVPWYNFIFKQAECH